MRRILVCSGVLGGGTALVFALAAATAMLFPQGTLLSGGGWDPGLGINGKLMPARGGVMVNDVVAMPAVEAPAIDEPAIDLREPAR